VARGFAHGAIKNLTPTYDRQAGDLSMSDIGFDFEESRVTLEQGFQAHLLSDFGSW
jgi:ectoine hydroxylase-related dioxygenase (phytanoyl-CoA dioxygenase family)